MHDTPSSRSASPPSRGTGTQDHDPAHRQARRLRVWALIVLIPVAVIGAALSFRSLYRAAEPVFGPQLALGFPLLVDFLILGASLQYVAGAKTGRPRAGWRWTAHAGVVGTLLLNAMAAETVREVPWHVTAPAVWSVLVELTAREVLGQWRAVHAPLGESIPMRLWLTAPLESARTWLRIARRVEGEQAAARLDVGVHAAAVEALKLALPQRRARRVRRILRRQLRAGSLPPSAVLGPLGWMDSADALLEVTPEAVLRAALRDTLRGAATPAPLPGPLPELLPPIDLPAAPPPAPAPAAPPPAPAPAAPPPAPAPAAPPPAPAPAPPPPAPAPAPPAATPTPAPPAPVATPPEPEVIDLTGPPTRSRPVVPVPTGEPELVDLTGASGTGDRFTDAVGIVRVHETISAPQLATQLRALGWQLSDRTAGRILTEVQEHLMRLDPWPLSAP